MGVAAEQVLLYAATTEDLQTVRGIVAALNLPSTSIQNNFDIVWQHVASGNYLVIAVGGAALDVLYYNQCVWSNPNPKYAAGGSTPFNIVPISDTLPGVNNFVNGAGTTVTDTLYISTAYAYYAMNGAYPAEFPSPPSPESYSQTCDATAWSDNVACPCLTSSACDSTSTFVDVCSSSQDSFVTNSTVLCWVEQASKKAQLPIALFFGQWLYEGTNVCDSIAAGCNNPANSEAGLFSGCGSSYTTSSCNVSGDGGYAGETSGLSGALMNAAVFNAEYCNVASQYQNTTLTTGGQELKSYAQSGSWTPMSNGMYNALYELGNYKPVWASSNYIANSPYLNNATPVSNVPGSGLVYLIGVHNLEQYEGSV